MFLKFEQNVKSVLSYTATNVFERTFFCTGSRLKGVAAGNNSLGNGTHILTSELSRELRHYCGKP